MWAARSAWLETNRLACGAVAGVAAAAAASAQRARQDGQGRVLWCKEVSETIGCARAAFSVGSYNVLCPEYALKWGEREGVGRDGACNWSLRWPVMLEILGRVGLDVVCLQEVPEADAADVADGLAAHDYDAVYFKHDNRPPDGLMIAVRRNVWRGPVLSHSEVQHNGVAFGQVDLVHEASGAQVRVVTAHCRGGRKDQLQALANFADAGGNLPDVTVIAADFNEDFAAASGTGEVACPFADERAGGYLTLSREEGLPPLSRPPHKQAADQKSGKGKVDWIFVRGADGRCDVRLVRDAASRLGILSTHDACGATGEWPSDHGMEAVTAELSEPAAELPPVMARGLARAHAQIAAADAAQSVEDGASTPGACEESV